MEVQHVFPLDDSKPHIHSPLCGCSPMFQEGDGIDLVIHRAFSGMAAVLQAEVAMGMRSPTCGHYIDELGDHTKPPLPYYEYTHPAVTI